MQIKILNGKYKIVKKIGKGSFGQIYLGVSQNGQQVAIKLQSAMAKIPQLMHEMRIYKHLHSQSTHQDKGIPKLLYSGLQGQYNLMVLQLLGPTLADFLDKLREFSIKTTLLLSIQMLKRIQFIHSKGLIHQDIKPENFAIGIGKRAHKINIFDFGLVKKYKNGAKHVPYSQGHSLCGTARYASINNHIGVQQTRRDDIQSFLYVLIHFIRGKLPWQGIKADNAQSKYRLIKEKKISIRMPKVIGQYLKNVRILRYDQCPNYNKMHQQILQVMKQNKIGIDDKFDWQ